MIRNGKRLSFYEVITAAVADFTEHGYDSVERLEYWMREIREAAIRDMVSEKKLEEELKKTFSRVWKSEVEKEGVIKRNPNVSKFTLEKVKPELRKELDRRIMASAQLIKLNREQAIEETLQRFAGWATSIPVGGSDTVEKNPVKTEIRKSLSQLPFRERRVLIDQGHKMAAAVNDVVAKGGGAIAAKWHSHWKQQNYNYRKDHKERDEKIYLIRDSWAHQKGLVKPGKAGYTDQITQPGEEVYCRCFYQYLFHVGELPGDMVTQKGKDELARVRAIIKGMKK
jgi:hypothetical protein